MSLAWRPWVEWGFEGDEEEHSFELPMRPFEPGDGGVGGESTAAAGLKAAYVIREDTLLYVELRVLETELLTVRSWWRWARRASTTFTFRLDQDDPSTEYSFWAHDPVLPQEIRWRRDNEYNRAFRVPLTFRLAQGQTLTTLWVDHLEDV